LAAWFPQLRRCAIYGLNMTGLVYVAIVALWAAVLIPMWLRRHDDDQARRLDRHRSAMGTLASFSAPQTAAARAAARRRRTLLAVLAVPAILGVGGWLLGVVPTTLMAVGVIPVVVYAPLAGLAARRGAERAAAAVPIVAPEDIAEEALSAEAVPAAMPTTDPAREFNDQRHVTAAPRRPRVPQASWDEVFDQSA